MSADPPVEPTAEVLEAARQALANACLRQPMNPMTAGISAYVNSVMSAARITALFAYLGARESGTEGLTLDRALLLALEEATAALDVHAAGAARIELAQSLPAALKAN